jgi:phosphopantothenoylcysteine decarboxylase
VTKEEGMAAEKAPRRAGRLLLCATGGWQCHTLPAFVLSLLRHVADDVQVVMSRAATRLVSPYAVEVASRHRVYVEMEDTGPEAFVPHIELSRAADLILVYPATVSIMGKIANGIADELVAALLIAATRPVVFVPVANPAMWEHPAVTRNMQRLKDDGYLVLPAMPDVEVATREGLDTLEAPFPHPTLLVQLRAALAPGSPLGVPHRRPFSGL